MKKLRYLFIFLLMFIYVGCGNASVVSQNSYNYTVNEGAIGDFSLTSPTDGMIVTSVPTFKWSKATNADTYTLEVSSSTEFKNTDTAYIKKAGIVDLEYNVSSLLKQKDCTYYYRVTAVNAKKSKLCSNGYLSFYLKANTDEEIEIPIDYADEWKVHEEGSKANVSIDKTNFFGNNANSLVVDFKEEDTNQGIPSSDGWIVITHSYEAELYGVDSFYFNFYYSGQNAKIFIRVVDEDNEYWNAEVKVANNNKQTVIIKFDEFTLRTKGGTTINNEVFDYNNIKYFEVVFEQSFGDGICMISDLKAISFEKYSHMFFTELNFNDVDKTQITNDNYNFSTSFAETGKSFTMTYSGSANEQNQTGIKGYGFVKIPVNKFMISGDAFKLKVNYTGSSAGKLLIRIIEEDGDRWVYRLPSNTIPENGEVLIPYGAFLLSEYKGDGSRQFYYLKQIQFGIEGVYSTGSITFENLNIVYLKDYVTDLYQTTIASDGLIDDFSSYTNSAEIYYKYMTSTSNKDEAMILEQELSFGANNKSVKLGYKTDMAPAQYGTEFKNTVKDFEGFSFWANDASIKYEDVIFNYIDDVSAKLIVTLIDEDDNEYVYVINELKKYWTKYNISLKDFRYSGLEYDDPGELKSEKVKGMMIGIQYYYYEESGKVHPMYMNNGYVYMDTFAFTHSDVTEVTDLAKKIGPSSSNPKICEVENFDSYTNDNVNTYWGMNQNLSYSKLAVSDDTPNATGKSLDMQYKGNSDSVSYSYVTLFSEEAGGKAIQLSLKGDGYATVYINIYFVYSGTTYKYRATLTKVDNTWNQYTIGFNNFTKVEGNGDVVLSTNNVKYITKITFGIVNSKDYNLSHVLVDDIKLTSEVGYATNTKTAIGG